MDFPALKRLKTHIQTVPQQFLSLSEKALRDKARPGKWSKMEILGHLLDSARYNLMRFTEISFLPHPYQVKSYQQDELVRVQGYQQASPANLIISWEMLNRQILSLLQSYPAESASWEILLPNGEEKDLFFLADDYVVHLEHHLKQIFGEKFSPPALQRSFSVAAARKKLQKVPTQFVELSRDGYWSFEYYAPEKIDLQQPHSRDEVYFVTSGSGMFVNGDKRHPFTTGDLLFVPAGVVHRFEDFTEDFGCWVVFGGREQ